MQHVQNYPTMKSGSWWHWPWTYFTTLVTFTFKENPECDNLFLSHVLNVQMHIIRMGASLLLQTTLSYFILPCLESMSTDGRTKGRVHLDMKCNITISNLLYLRFGPKWPLYLYINILLLIFCFKRKKTLGFSVFCLLWDQQMIVKFEI